MPVATLPVVDLVALAVLALCAVWGAVRGPWRQLLGLGLLAGAFAVATRFGPRFEDTVVRAVSAEGTNLAAVSWSAVFVAVLLAGGLMFALLQPLLGRTRHRASGALLGLAHGLVVGTILIHAALAVFAGPGEPAWINALARSPTARAAATLGSGMRRLVSVPPWLEDRLDAVDERISGVSSVPESPPPGVQGSERVPRGAAAP